MMMQLPTIKGVIDRRMLVNYRVDPTVAARVLPAPFKPKLVDGYAIAGICLIRLKQIRPAFSCLPIGVSSENAAHRFAVQWQSDATTSQDIDAANHEGVYIPRRDSSSRLNALLGGRLVPGIHRHARFDVRESGSALRVGFKSDDGTAHVEVEANVVSHWPRGSVFASLAEASRFFEAGSLGYSATSDPSRHEGIELRCKEWSVEPLHVTKVHSSYFEDTTLFPTGSAIFDCALLMRNVAHEWHPRRAMCCS